jgi:hypothetical protein
MTFRTFWLGWRRDVIRFAVLCLAALALGLFINHASARLRHDLKTVLKDQDFTGLDPDPNLIPSAGPKRLGDRWSYRAHLNPGQGVWVRNGRGSITVEPSRGDSLVVEAVKSFSGSDPHAVRVVAVPGEGGIAICALWRDEGSHCGTGDAFEIGSLRHSDVEVQFTVRLPRGVRFDANTVTGGIAVRGATAPVAVKTVDGDVDVETTRGPVSAFDVNGSIHAVIHGFADAGAVRLTTVNGAVTAELPARLDAIVKARTVNGRIASDFPLAIGGNALAHRADGVIGAGGRPVELNAVNGSIHLKALTPPTSR